MAYDELRRLALICQAHMMFPSASEVLGYSFFVKIVEHLFDIFQTTFSWLHLSLGLHLSEWRGKSCLSIWEIHDKLMRGKHNNTTSTQPAPAFYSYKYHNIWFNKRETNWPIWRKKNLYFEREETKVIFIIENDEKERRYRLVSLMVPGHILVMVIYWLGYPKF